MDSPKVVLLLLLSLLHLAVAVASASAAEADGSAVSIGKGLFDEWETGAAFYEEEDEELGEGFGDEEIIADFTDSPPNRRSLFWKRVFRYYISYGALAANRIPCPPRSGRSYYTHNCYRARGPVRPYYRGCSAITRCRR
ncbi:protein RALF-like 34 [Andrographis paniculata]|uniref:protein RALF-like 34 n=1 Tax=Andrographis paniculata TaxID=175694 RepID=UPI0021E961BC|nr:protein RALF-like 34 [Andrographis paniculata]